MIDILGVCKGSGNVVCRMAVGPVVIKVSKAGRQYYSLLNNRIIAEAKSEKEFSTRSLPLLATVIKSLCKNHLVRTVKYASTNKIEDILKYIRERSEPAEIQVLESKPDEITDNKPPVDQQSLSASIRRYRSQLPELQDNFDNMNHVSKILLRTNLSKDVWGHEEINDLLTTTRKRMANLSEDAEKIDFSIEASGRLLNAFESMYDRKLPIKEVAGKIIDNFSRLKSYASVVAQNLQNFSGIDTLVQKKTGFPATWFFCSSTLMDFMYEYENLINNLIKMAETEGQLIEPLLVLKIKSTGV